MAINLVLLLHELESIEKGVPLPGQISLQRWGLGSLLEGCFSCLTTS
ncbi:MAG: hypothetical protein IGS50_04300 [Synechococcales cyanobacterium C42_A2020_086]|jgi:hypothetical protein|nr:hypothetical protein [Synechococcales cyanobacterium C42_A2020_086]